MSAVLPVNALNVHRSEADPVDKCRGLQNMTSLFPGHAAAGDTAQFVFDHRSHLLQGHLISLAPGLEKLRNPSPWGWFTLTRNGFPRAARTACNHNGIKQAESVFTPA